ncbi:ABC transporter permease [Sulfurovum sp.]|jgi:putative ABC transport system permease protein|uniref:ABC transporter permease n=1 Tax=Sulfurovum sp. TaxID=1969726 RepID=UPI002A358D73|nr:ABC transporter permease [Sulfurovum sp.]MDD2451404.1 ABC transporter permease [Sulfurovum sp.]MDD3499434.1 ABC transporter permease [Sulfurovum sp.]MDY0402968.1 ABC transporter permease [Sulfurovum sp.]
MKPMINREFVHHIIRHYLKYDKDNPFIFISALLAFLGISAGVMVLMIAMGIMNGTQKEFTKRLFVMNYPLTVLPITQDAANDTLIAMLQEKFPHLQISPYYTTQVITKNAGAVQGSLLYGIDFDKESRINHIFEEARGQSEDSYRIVIGDSLSFEMDAPKGEKVTLYFSEQEAIGFATMPLQKRFVVDGVFDSGLKAYDKAIIYTTLTAFQKLLKREAGYYDGLHIYTEEPLKEIDAIRAALPESVIIEGWWQQNGNFFAAMEMEKKALFLVLLLIILVASLNIISSLLMTVMSRRSEIALMRTLGASKAEIRSIFFKLGLIIGSTGILVGALLGFFGIWILKTFDIISMPADVYGTTKLPVDLMMSDFGLIILGTSVIILLSSLYPAKKASQTDPLTVLRNE